MANGIIQPTTAAPMSNQDEDFVDGDFRKRTCTDIPFLVLLLAYLGGMGYVAYLGVTKGDPYRLIYGVDSWGNVCGRNNTPVSNVTFSGQDMTKLPHAYYYNGLDLIKLPQSTYKSTVVCVKSCPNRTLLTVNDMRSYYTETGVHLCRYDIPLADFKNGTNIGDTCPILPVIPHQSVLRRCIPKVATDIKETVLGSIAAVLGTSAACKNTGDFFTRSANDLTRTWREIIYLSLIALGFSFTIIVMMRFLAAVVIYGVLLLYSLGAIGATAYCWVRWHYYKTDLSAIPKDQRTYLDTQRERTWLGIAIAVLIVTVITLLIILAILKHVALLIRLFKEASKVVISNPFMLFQPFVTLIVIVSISSGLIFLFLYIETAGDIDVTTRGRVTIKPDKAFLYLKWFYIFGVLWVINFMFACNYIVLTGGVGKWYFTRDKSKVKWALTIAARNLICFHMGTAAFGSFILTLVEVIRMVLEFMQKRLSGTGNKIAKFILCCLRCCFWCLEKVLRAVNSVAYTYTALFGYNFCKAAVKSFKVLVEYAVTKLVFTSISAFVFFLAKMLIVALILIIGLEAFFKGNTEICYIWIPMLVATVCAYIIAEIFFSTYGIAINTLYICFFEDIKRNDGVNKPYYMSKGLMKFAKAKKVIPDDAVNASSPVPSVSASLPHVGTQNTAYEHSPYRRRKPAGAAQTFDPV